MPADVNNIVRLVDHGVPGLDNIPQLLRNLADNIEAGEHGEVVRAAVVLRAKGREPIVCGQGHIVGLSETYMDLMAGAQELMSMRSPSRD